YSAGSNRATNVPVTILYNGGSVTYAVNETTNGGAWQPLAAGLDFAAGSAGFALIENNTGETNSVVMADALKWSYVLSQDNPGDGSVPSWWANFYFGADVEGAQDADGDGWSNYAEYILGTDPTDTSSRLQARVDRTVTGIQMTFNPRLGGRVY